MASRTVSNTTPKAILDTCLMLGANEDDVLLGTGVSAESLKVPTGRLEFERVLDLWDASYEVTGNRMIGIETARRLPFGAF